MKKFSKSDMKINGFHTSYSMLHYEGGIISIILKRQCLAYLLRFTMANDIIFDQRITHSTAMVCVTCGSILPGMAVLNEWNVADFPAGFMSLLKFRLIFTICYWWRWIYEKYELGRYIHEHNTIWSTGYSTLRVVCKMGPILSPGSLR